MKNIIILFLVGFLLTLSIGCGNVYPQKSLSEKAVDFQLEDINGGVVRLSDYSGKIIILNFFATWCPPCRMEMPDFNELAKEYKNEVEIIAVNVGGESTSKVKNFARDLDLKFKILMDDGKVSMQYGPIRAIPVTIVIDRKFNIAKKYIGARSKEDFVRDIKELEGL